MNSTTKNTMTTGELIRILSTYPELTPVMAGWEGMHTPILRDNIIISDYCGTEILEIDVEEY